MTRGRVDLFLNMSILSVNRIYETCKCQLENYKVNGLSFPEFTNPFHIEIPFSNNHGALQHRKLGRPDPSLFVMRQPIKGKSIVLLVGTIINFNSNDAWKLTEFCILVIVPGQPEGA